MQESIVIFFIFAAFEPLNVDTTGFSRSRKRLS